MVLLLAGTLGLAQDPADDKLPEQLGSMAERVLDKVEPYIVSILVDREKEKAPPRPRGRNRPTVFRNRPVGPVTGTIADDEGHILTSYFNVSGNVNKITVTVEGEEYEAELRGYNGSLDIALLKIDAQGLPAPPTADLDKLKVGDPVYAIGKSPKGGDLTLDAGMVSALFRYNGRMLQHDGSANFGNTGGPLVDARGRVLGITCLITTERADRFGQNSGISFAARWDRIDAVMPKLVAGEKIKVEMRPYLGVTLNNEYTGKGAGIAQVQPGTAAEKSGFESGDVIIRFGEFKVDAWGDLVNAIRSHKPEDTVKVLVVRKGKEIELEVTLGSRPDN
jgi:serine protease Do